MNKTRYDVLVIGSGPGGEGAAMKAAKEGKSVAVIERYHEVGGACTHWTTIPSKTLRHAIQRFAEARDDPFLKWAMSPRAINYPDLVKTAESVIRRQVILRQGFYDRNRVDIIGGQASFVDPNTIRVTKSSGVEELYHADYFIIATGASPYHPKDIDFTHPRIFDSDTVLNMPFTPQTMTIYGAGIVGCEYASIFRGLDIKINLVNTRDKLLSFLDDEIIDALSYHLRDQGVLIRHNEEYEKIEPQQDDVILHLKSGKKIRSDVFLWANGRTGNTRNLGLDAIGIPVNSREQIDVNSNYQTSIPHVYAVGDIIGFPSLASAAYDQGRYAATHLAHGMCDTSMVQYMPTGIYTSPEISCVGRTERDLTAAQIPYEVGHSLFRSLARAQIANCTVGMLKILFHRQTLEIYGIHCFGSQAAEIIHIGQAVMSQKGDANTLLYFVNRTFNYPTMAEAYRVAALNGLNRIF
jgi:NAD(P) transhydrogenase